VGNSDELPAGWQAVNCTEGVRAASWRGGVSENCMRSCQQRCPEVLDGTVLVQGTVGSSVFGTLLLNTIADYCSAIVLTDLLSTVDLAITN